MPQDVEFPAELGNMKSLRELGLGACGLRAVPSFVGELKSLEGLGLSENNVHICTTLDLVIKGCPSLRHVELNKGKTTAPWTPKTRAYLEALKEKLRAKNPSAIVIF